MIEASIKKSVTEGEVVAKAKTLVREIVLKAVLHQCWDSKVSCFS